MSTSTNSELNITHKLTLPCGAVLKNRLSKAAMTERLAEPNGHANERHARLYQKWAEGGAGMLLTGNVQIDHRYLEAPGNVVIEGPQSEAQLAALKAWAKPGHQMARICGCKFHMLADKPRGALMKHRLAPAILASICRVICLAHRAQ